LVRAEAGTVVKIRGNASRRNGRDRPAKMRSIRNIAKSLVAI
jgi:hypothetical protein